VNDLNDQADARPDWADQTRGQCQTCRDWPKLTKAGLTVKHMRSEPGRWRKVPCEGSGALPLPAAAEHHARLAAGTEEG
jgi:hypothetical protein